MRREREPDTYLELAKRDRAVIRCRLPTVVARALGADEGFVSETSLHLPGEFCAYLRRSRDGAPVAELRGNAELRGSVRVALIAAFDWLRVKVRIRDLERDDNTEGGQTC